MKILERFAMIGRKLKLFLKAMINKNWLKF